MTKHDLLLSAAKETAAAQADSQCGLGVGMPTPAPASSATHITDEAGNFVLAPTSRTPTVTPAPTTDEHDITEARIATWRDRVNRLERALAVYQRASAELPEEPKGWGCQVAEYESEWVVAIEDYRALRAAAVALKAENSTLKVEYEQMNDAAILLQERAEKAEAALAEARKAGFKLTAALCALPEDDKEKISRPRVMELVIAWRSDLDAAKEQKK